MKSAFFVRGSPQVRARCKQDKRQMYFSLTAAGGERLAAMQCEEIDLSAFQF